MNTGTAINLSSLFAMALATSAHATPGAGHLSVWGAKRWEQEFATPGFTQVTCGGGFAAGVRADGSVACWGLNDELQCRPPADIGLIAAVDAGTSHVVALRQNGTVVCWGSTWDGRTAGPAGLSQVVAVAAGDP
jgi:alpha-tubulin suppressor-like RCC1 family protein